MGDAVFMGLQCFTDGTMAATKHTRTQGVIRIAKVLITLAVLWFIGTRLGFSHIMTTLRQAQGEWIITALVLFFLSGALGVVQWRMLLHNRGVSISFVKAFSLYFIGLFFNNFILGLVAGDAVKVAYLSHDDKKGKQGFAATFLDRFAGLWAMCGFAVAGSIILFAHHHLSGNGLLLCAGVLLLMFILFVGVLLFLISKRLQQFFFLVLGRLPLPGKENIAAIISQTLIQAHDVRLLLPVGVIATLVQLLRIGVHICCAGSLGLLSMHNLLYFFIFVPIIALVMIVPLPFGIRESVGGALFSLSGFAPDTAIIMQFLATLVGIAASLLGGVFFLFRGSSTPGTAGAISTAPVVPPETQT
jgi:uncharacterized protein (TIRG00374 family)